MAVRTVPVRTTKVPEIRKGDTVVVLAGKDAGKRGTVERVIRRLAARARPEHVPARLRGRWRQRRGRGPQHRQAPHQAAPDLEHERPRCPRSQQGGIIDIAQPMPIGKVMLVCSSCDKPTRIGHATLDNGRRVRVCRHCGEQLEVKA